MQINMQFDVSGLTGRTQREQKRLAYNVAEALNKTGLAAQQAIRAHITEVFHLRTSTKRDRKWLLEQVKFTFASPTRGRIYCEVYIQPRARLLLAGFETGMMREPFVGRNVAVPNPQIAREGGTVAGAVMPELTFRALGLKPFQVHPKTQPDTVQYKAIGGSGAGLRVFGLQHTAGAPLGGVFQRIGPGRDDIRMVYSFRRAFQLRAVLDFFKTARTTMEDKFQVEWVLSNARNPST